MNSSYPEMAFWLAALHVDGMGPVKFLRYLSTFPDMKTLFLAPVSVLTQAGLAPKEISALKNLNWSAIEAELRWCEKFHCRIITIRDLEYPALLREIHSPPLVLFVQGKIEALSKPQLAMVGTRHPTAAGYDTAQQFANHLAKAGLVITSGLALGIDTASHHGALLVGETIAVLGAGLHTIYPPSNQKLAAEILANGALVSEYPPFVLPIPKNFPKRNRIISGMSAGVLVIEAALQSGSLITARNALEQGREVFAIPGSIHNPLVKGCHYLLRQGAKLVETAADVMEELGGFLDLLNTPQPIDHSDIFESDLDLDLKKVLQFVGFEATYLDTIIVRSGLTSAEVSSILLSLELEGYVQTVPGGYVRTASKTA